MGIHHALGRLAVRGKIQVSYLVDKLFTLRLKVHVYPSDMMFNSVGMRNLFAHADRDLEGLPGLHRVGTF